jgi:hypothetical protein
MSTYVAVVHFYHVLCRLTLCLLQNISNIKIIDQGKASNILVELGMTSDDYAWCRCVFLRASFPFLPDHFSVQHDLHDPVRPP